MKCSCHGECMCAFRVYQRYQPPVVEGAKWIVFAPQGGTRFQTFENEQPARDYAAREARLSKSKVYLFKLVAGVETSEPPVTWTPAE